jgi:lipopolysaccharide transport system ATP-binding protein
MSDIAIKVENLSKQYHIGQLHQRHDTLREALTASLGRFRRNTLPKTQNKDDTIWALKDVSFEVKRGEVVGIIGRNGAGKSTLLKILTRITEPTRGRAELHGRVGSLLEVGTGFHLELTGRENIYLSGTILGMKKSEIDRRFDEIVAFSGVEKFIDTPVKRYSSGMNVRLGFAVAAHLEPEILLVDEVLSVGDAAFQKKCLGKMEDVAREGRTVLFVSHNISMILRLCERVLLLDSGMIAADGDANYVTRTYMSLGASSPAERIWTEIEKAPGDSVARLTAVRVLNEQSEVSETIDILKPAYLEIEYWNLRHEFFPTAIVHVINEEGICLFASNDWSDKIWKNTPRTPGLVRAKCKIPGNFLAEGRLFVLAAIGTYNPNVIHALEHDAVSFLVIDRSQTEGVRGEYSGGSWPGVIRPALEWVVEICPGLQTTHPM